MTEWETPDGQKAGEITGPVEWEWAGMRLRLGQRQPAGAWPVEYCRQGGWGRHHAASDHEAACLRRDQAREWLEERHWQIRRDDSGWYPYHYAPRLGLGLTYDAALIAAILAVGKD